MKDLTTMDYLVQILGFISAIQTVRSYRIKRKIKYWVRLIKTAITLITWIAISGVALIVLSYLMN